MNFKFSFRFRKKTSMTKDKGLPLTSNHWGTYRAKVKDGKIQDVIYQWDKRGYELIPSLSFAKQLGKTVDIDDVAMIKNTSEKSKVSIHC